jgi:ATP-binding cassette subfamily B (MDR/TAP) protein 1
VSLITNFFQVGMFHVLGQRITSKLRIDLYKHFLTRDMEFFDDPNHNPGELSSVLAKDCLTVNTIVSSSYGAILNSAGSFICGITIAMIASWRLSLVALSLSPFIVVTGYLESKLLQPPEIEKADTRESKTFQEVCTNMRTVNSLNAQPFLFVKFYKYVVAENDSKVSSTLIKGIVYGIGQFAMFAIYSLTFYAGAEFTMKYDLQYRDLFRSLFAIIFAAFGAGMGQQFAGNIGEAELASKKIFDYMDIQNKIKYSENPFQGEVKGHIEIRNVKFTYPQRKQACFNGLSLTIEPKQKIAFAGPSGTGKSTIFSLLYRFYDVDEGEILIDGVNIKDYDIKHLRSSLGMVSQEPVLFNNSIRYNIKYNQPQRTDAEMEDAATIANAISFIKNDEKNESPVVDQPKDGSQDKEAGDAAKEEEADGHGFDRSVGLKGSKLSGGQKQRVAIARTVIRRPQVYMFDESTSALDTQSERIVQDALNKISEHNTSLAIAHRIATIKDSDVIFMIDGGKVVEKGTYNQLIEMKGAFYQLNKNH